MCVCIFIHIAHKSLFVSLCRRRLCGLASAPAVKRGGASPRLLFIYIYTYIYTHIYINIYNIHHDPLCIAGGGYADPHMHQLASAVGPALGGARCAALRLLCMRIARPAGMLQWVEWEEDDGALHRFRVKGALQLLSNRHV